MTARPARKRQWRKRLTRAVLCLLLGAVTTVGVAWGCVLFSPDHHAWIDEQADDWPFADPRWALEPVEGPQFVTRNRFFGGKEVGAGIQDALWQSGTTAGWPWYAANGWQDYGAFSSIPQYLARSWALPIPKWLASDHNDDRLLPTRPCFPGFLLDTLFYAAPWWLILITPGAVKRWRRRRLGRCIHCGYDLAGLEAGAACPECGQRSRAAR